MTNNKLVTKSTRKRGNGSISFHKSGRYLGRITLSGYPQYSCYGDTEQEVEKKLKQYKEKILKGELIAKKIKVSVYIEDWLKTVKFPNLKSSSYDRLESTYINHIKNYSISRLQLGNITAKEIQLHINNKSVYLSYSSIKKIYELLNSCFTYATIIHDMNENPMIAVTLPKESNLTVKTKEIEILSPSELNSIFKIGLLVDSKGNPLYKYTYAFSLIANTGLRCGEALSLRWDNVDLINRTISVCNSVSIVKVRNSNNSKRTEQKISSVKTRKGNRIIPLNDIALYCINWLKSYQKKNVINTDYVISTSSGKMVLPSTFQRLFDRVLQYANIRHVGIHSLRHSFATNLINCGAEIKTVSTLLGHSTITLTYNTYIHTDISKSITTVSLLNGINGTHQIHTL